MHHKKEVSSADVVQTSHRNSATRRKNAPVCTTKWCKFQFYSCELARTGKIVVHWIVETVENHLAL